MALTGLFLLLASIVGAAPAQAQVFDRTANQAAKASSFGTIVEGPDLAAPTRTEAADVDGDGDPDVVAYSEATGELVWYENQSDGFGAKQVIASGVEVDVMHTAEAASAASGAHTYRYTDASPPFSADSLSYRLKAIGIDGAATYSDRVVARRGAPREVRLLDTYPNPAQSRVTVRLAVPDAQKSRGQATLRLYDLLGREIRTVSSQVGSGRHQLHLSVEDLPSGTYVLRLAAGGTSETRRLTVVR